MPNESLDESMLGKTTPNHTLSDHEPHFTTKVPDAAVTHDSHDSISSYHAVSMNMSSFENEMEKYGAWSGSDIPYSYWPCDLQPSHLVNPNRSMSSMIGDTVAMEDCSGNVTQVAETLNSVWDTPPVMPGDVLPDLFNLAVKIASVSNLVGQNALLSNEENGIFNHPGSFLHNSSGSGTTDLNPLPMQSALQPIPLIPELRNKWPSGTTAQLEVGPLSVTRNSDLNEFSASTTGKYNAMLTNSTCVTSEPNSEGQFADASTPSAYTPSRRVDLNCVGISQFGSFSPSNLSGRDMAKPTGISNKWRTVGSPSFSSPKSEIPGVILESSEKGNAKPKLSCRNLSSQWASWPSNVDPGTLHSSVGENSSQTSSNACTPLKDWSNTQETNKPKPERGAAQVYKNNAMLKENCAPLNEITKTVPSSNFTNGHNDVWRPPYPPMHGVNSGMQKKGSESARKEADTPTERPFNNVHDENFASTMNAFLNIPNTMSNMQSNSSVNPYGFTPSCFAASNSSNGRVHYGENFVSNMMVGGHTQAIIVPRVVDALPAADPQFQQGPGRGTNAELKSLMQELASVPQLKVSESIHMRSHSSSCRPSSSIIDDPLSPNKGCVFCKNNGYHSTFYKSHALKDERGCCTCPVLRTYVCPLCGASGDAAHTIKYCPFNMVTGGDPVAVGLPPGKVTNWRDVAQKMAFASKSPPREIYWRT